MITSAANAMVFKYKCNHCGHEFIKDHRNANYYIRDINFLVGHIYLKKCEKCSMLAVGLVESKYYFLSPQVFDIADDDDDEYYFGYYEDRMKQSVLSFKCNNCAYIWDRAIYYLNETDRRNKIITLMEDKRCPGCMVTDVKLSELRDF